jgi:hypothetical protein
MGQLLLTLRRQGWIFLFGTAATRSSLSLCQAQKMAGDTRTSKTKRRRRGVAALGVAGALSLVSGVCGACGASAATTPAGNMQKSARALLAEEEISDVSLSTFYSSTRKMPRAQVSNLLPATVVAGTDAEADMDAEDVAARRVDAAAMAVGAAGAGAAAAAMVAVVVAAVAAVFALAPSASVNLWAFRLLRSLVHAQSVCVCRNDDRQIQAARLPHDWTVRVVKPGTFAWFVRLYGRGRDSSSAFPVFPCATEPRSHDRGFSIQRALGDAGTVSTSLSGREGPFIIKFFMVIDQSRSPRGSDVDEPLRCVASRLHRPRQRREAFAISVR